MTDEEFLEKYEEFVRTQFYPHFIYKCDSCEFLYGSHPLRYCSKCPGKIVRCKMTFYDYFFSRLRPFYDDFGYDFWDYVGENTHRRKGGLSPWIDEWKLTNKFWKEEKLKREET